MKNITIRFAWHDSKWNGRIDKSPEKNVYARGNYSLLSPRVQRRINIKLEEEFKGKKISEIIKKKYLPPTYWTINALGDDTFQIEDLHPFTDVKSMAEKFKQVPPLKDKVEPFSVFTWCFKISFERDDANQNYPPPEELDKRVREYINDIKKNKSIAFFYANYSNPVNGDDYRYLLLGAGLIEDIELPQTYKIPKEILDGIRSRQKMKNFPEMVWQFKIKLNPNLSFVLPYHEYLDLIEKSNSVDKNINWKKLDEISIPIVDKSSIPHFKYVSMHIPQDKSIYLLYLIKKSLSKIKDHKIVDYNTIKDIEGKLEKLMENAWNERTKYPGLKNALCSMLKHDFDADYLSKIVSKIMDFIKEKVGDYSKFMLEPFDFEKEKERNKLIKPLRLIERNKELIEFLSQFDFSITQFNNILELISEMGLETVKQNPYVLLERYNHDMTDDVRDDYSDFGLDVYQFDIALIPDPKYTSWESNYDANSAERIRAVIAKILDDAASQEGSSCLTRQEILKRVEEYPLYYITEKLKLDAGRLASFEKETIFKEKFSISQKSIDEPVYQLKLIREIENVIEKFTQKVLAKKYILTDKDKKDIKKILQDEERIFEGKINILERKQLYENTLKNGLFLLSGKAGSGKTSSIINLIKKFRDDKLFPIYIFTPTGKANLVIRNRLKEWNLHTEQYITVSTIHRFLYRQLFEYFDALPYNRKNEVFRLTELIGKILSGNYEVLHEFFKLARDYRSNPQVIIIDEASMINESLLAALFCLINPDRLKHLIIVGDQRQLPPIGVGRPFVDMIYYLRKNNVEANTIHLESNLRFDASAKLGLISEFFSGDESPLPPEVEEIFKDNDKSLTTDYFNNGEELKKKIQNILLEVGKIKPESSLPSMFAKLFEEGDELNLEKLQIITPRRVGSFGSTIVNFNIIREGHLEFSPQSKLICEENIYVDAQSKGKKKRILALANGSIGYIKSDNRIHFEDIDDLFKEYKQKNERIDYKEMWAQINQKTRGEYNVLKTEKGIDFGYAITVHKSQGSDFDYVILIVSEISPFIGRELIYTALTRAKNKLYLLIHQDLKETLPLVLIQAFENSSIEQRNTLLFGYKVTPFRPYSLTLKSGQIIEVISKIEYIIAKKLDELGVSFEYEPKEFLEKYHIKPDFKIIVKEKTYYLEHLGRMDIPSYKNRWYSKLRIYTELGLLPSLITTDESSVGSNVEENIENIFNDIVSGSLKKTESGYSQHHYSL